MTPISLVSATPSIFSKRVEEFFGSYVGARNLNLGCAKNHEPGFVNLDMTPDVGADVVFNLERCGNGERLPFEDGSFDCILGSHVFEHIVHLVDVVNELYRVLRPGGYLLSVTPYVSSDDAWDSPHHVRAFSENTWHYFTKQLYERTTLEHAGFGATQGQTYQSWEVVVNHFIPYPDLAHHDQARLDFMKRHWRNVIQELHVVLRKPEAV